MTKSPHLKLMEGNPGRRPIPKPSPQQSYPMPNPPTYLSEEALREWRRVAPVLHAAGLIRPQDAAILGAYCAAYSRLKRAEHQLSLSSDLGDEFDSLLIRDPRGALVPHPLIGVARSAASDMLECVRALGMSPAARKGLQDPLPEPVASKWAGLLKTID